jgi:predicted metalloendopeptidase
LWCSSVPNAQEYNQMTTDPHSPGDLRADGAVQNLRDPQTGISPMELAYGCQQGETVMVPEETCELW